MCSLGQSAYNVKLKKKMYRLKIFLIKCLLYESLRPSLQARGPTGDHRRPQGGMPPQVGQAQGRWWTSRGPVHCGEDGRDHGWVEEWGEWEVLHYFH